LRGRLRNDLCKIIKQAGLTALYVTHDQEEAAALADQIGVMSGGKLLQFARTEILFGRPAFPEVARFIGAANQIDMRVVSRAGGRASVVDRNGLRLDVTAIDDLRAGDAACVMFRPENLRLGAPESANGAPRGRIVERQYLGGQAVYTVDVGGTRFEAMDLGTVTRWRPGDEAALVLDPAGAWAYRAA
jgi:iron(III) transport system ATP-binding protein